MKPFYRLLCLLALALLVTPPLLHAASVRVGKLYYDVNSDGTCSVTYKSEYSSNNRDYVSDNLVIPEKITYNSTEYSVTTIGKYAFSGCSGLTSVSIPNSITSIGYDAFYGCSSLAKVIYNAENCISCASNNASVFPRNLKEVIIGNSVKAIPENAFSGCSGLTKAEFASIESICSIKFANYDSNPLSYAHHLYIDEKEITELMIPESVTSIGDYAFQGCSILTSVSIPNSVTSIGNRAFSGCSGLISLTIGNSVTSIGDYAFYGCTGLTSVSIPNSVTLIDHSAFSGCTGLTSVTIGNSVTSIGHYAFSGCTDLTSVTIGESVTSIGNGAFYSCSGLTSVTIPNSVTSIGEKAFCLCSGLTKAEFASIKSLCSIKFVDNIANPLTYAQHLYVGGKEVSELVIPESVTAIGSYAFYGCSGLTSVSIPNSVTSIGNRAFYGCSGLTSVTIGNSVTSIGDSAFEYCSGLEKVLYNAQNCTTCGSSNSPIFPSTLKEVMIGNSVRSISAYIFYNCSSLTSVSIPNSVTSICNYAFYGCSGLTSVSIPNSVTSIGNSAFCGCTSLTSLDIPESLTSIGYDVFYGCKNLFNYEVKNVGQTTATIDVKYNGFNGCDLFCDNTKLKIGENTIKGLTPGSYQYFYAKRNITISLTDLDSSYKFRTKNATITSNNKVTASSVEISPKFTIDCDVEEYWKDNSKLKGMRTETGLDPKTNYSYIYCIDGPNWYQTENLTATTQQLTMTTLPGVALNSSTALLCSEVNLHEDEVNVGFEWRRYDAPETLPSSKVACAIVDGKLTGALSGLNPAAYYNYRPYYTSNSGKTYYGEWITVFTGDAGVHFDPTVKTYSASMLDDFSAQLKGYALRGSDEIARQGFQYWSNWGSRAAGDVTEVEVKGQKFTHTLTDLHPSTTYYYRTFVETAGGKFYGEEQNFTTPELDGVEDITADSAEVEIIGYYNLQGIYSAKPFQGLNIVVYSDGTTRKMILR